MAEISYDARTVGEPRDAEELTDWHYGEKDFTDEMFNRMLRHFEADSKRLGQVLSDQTTNVSQ